MSNEWIETTEDDYENQLGSMPPVRYLANGFVCGEPADHSERGPIHTTFMIVNDRYFRRDICLVDLSQPDFIFWHREDICYTFKIDRTHA